MADVITPVTPEAEPKQEGTKFSAIYNRFLGKITDDMYMELTPEDTIKDLQSLLIDALPGFEFPRFDLFNYTVSTQVMPEDQVEEGDFIIGVIWNEIGGDDDLQVPDVIVEKSSFGVTLTPEEQNIIALLMKQGWVQRQVTSIEQTRMKYSGSDFKFTSQANHLSKWLNLLEESRRDSFHMQRLYKRRKLVPLDANNPEDTRKVYASNWSSLRENSALE